MTIRRWVTVLTVAATLAACSAPESPEALLERARQAIARGDVNAAVIDIKTALQQESDNAEARLLLGRAYLAQNDPASAVDEFRRAARGGNVAAEAEYARAMVAAGRAADLIDFHEQSDNSPAVNDDPLYLAALSRAYNESGNPEAANAALAQALATGSESAYLLVTRALLALQDSQETGAAAALLERATKEFPADAEAWSLRANVARVEGNLEAAADFYARAAELNPARLADRLSLVDIALQIGRSEQAQTQLAKLEKVIPNHPGVNFARGRMLLDAGDYSAGLQELSRVLGSMPQHAGSLYLSGVANAREGNLATAQNQLTQFLEVQPGHLPARLELASVYLRMQEPAAAESVARRVLDTDPKNVVAMRLLATALGAQGLFAESAEVYADLAAVDPDSIDARIGLGTTQLLSGNSEGGLAEFRSALVKEPDNDELRERVIATELAMGNIEAAQAEAQAYRARSDESVRSLILAGRVALQAGEAEEARDLFNGVLQQDPHNRDANGGLAALALANSDIATAREYFQDSLQAYPGDLATLMNLAVLAERSGDADAMEASLRSAIDSNEDALRPRVALSRYRIQQGNPEAAIRLLMPVERENTESFALHHALASAHLANESPAFALDSARRALELQPRQPAALVIAARAEQANGRYAAAQTHMESALALTDDVTVRKLLVENLILQNKLDPALKQIGLLPESERETPAARLLLGRIAMAQERYSEAESLFQTLFEGQDDGASLAYLTGAQWALGKQQEVIASLQSWLADNPGDVELRNQLATRYLLAGDEEGAREEYRRLLEDAPESPLVLNNLAWLERERDSDRALEYVRRASKLAPDSIQIMDTHAMVERARGNYAVALQLSAKALAAAPDAPELRLNRALILVDAGRTSEARSMLEELLAGPVSPQHDEARRLLATL